MKYLENEKLNKISAELSEAVLKDSHRIIQGRIEAYIMKRAGNDKKYAHALGQKYVAEIEDMQEELAATVERKKRRLRSNSESYLTTMMQSSSSSSSSNTTTEDHPSNYFTGDSDNAAIDAKKSKVTPSSPLAGASSSSSAVIPAASASESVGLRRSRARSFDCTLDSYSPKTTIGDFSELSTRKLMTDLILTLNASFPDYDFSTMKPNQFHKLHMDDVKKSIHEKLSEFASQNSSPNFLGDLWYAVDDVITLGESDAYSFEYEFDNEDSLWNFHYLFVNKSARRIVLFTCSERIDCNADTTLICRAEDGQTITTVLQEGYYESDHQQVRYYSTMETQSESDDVDWNPSDNVAGGMSLEVTIGG